MSLSANLARSPNCEVKSKYAVLAIRFVTFAYHHDEIKILLLKINQSEKWKFPTGQIRSEESITEAAERIICEITKAKDLFFHQIGVMESSPIDDSVVYINYYVMIRWTANMTSKIMENYRWFAIHRQPPLMGDNGTLLKNAHAALIKGLNYHPIGYFLLYKHFTLGELQNLYEQILAIKLNNSKFRRKMLAQFILRKLNDQQISATAKASDLYKYDKGQYFAALQTGLEKVF